MMNRTRSDNMDAQRWNNVGRLFLLGNSAFAARVEAKVRASGFKDFEGALPTLVRAMQVEGSRINDLAARARMTPQGMGQIVSDAARRGYVAVVEDPIDRRARKVRYTRKGKRLAETAVGAIAEVEEEFRRTISAKKFAELKTLLAELVDNLPETQSYYAAFFSRAGHRED